MGNTFNRLTVTPGSDDCRNDEPTPDELREVPPVEDNAQLLEIMRSKDYKESPLYRKLVHAALAKSASNVGITTQRQEKAPDVGNMVEARMQYVKDLFKNPLYKTSAVYRQQVAQMIQQSNEPTQHGKTMRVEYSNDPSKWAKQTGTGAYRVEFEAQKTGFYKPEKPQPKPRDPREVDLY